jgi:NAD-dependent deacetylase
MNTLYITGAGVSSESGIPTFRGEDGYWTIGSINYTPQEMATRYMYQQNPVQFLSWYYQRFATYRHHGPNSVHRWLANKNLITQNIDGLDGKAGNKNFIAIHGRLDQMTLFHHQGDEVEVMDAPWDDIGTGLDDSELESQLLKSFRIQEKPILEYSYKPFVLLFDEYYTDLYRISEAQQRIEEAEKIVFMGTSFSVNITQMALQVATSKNIPIEIVDPEPVNIGYELATYFPMKASEYIVQHS